VTGAPKIRATQRISELESSPRGVYCGAIGYVADGGEAAWSVAIRTACWHRDTVRFHVGGGIVFDSDPTEEWLETEHKAKAMQTAFLGHRG
jgi:anthranilate/para-aminobenzoate synthase component I